MYKHILIPTDGSDVAAGGVEHGLALAKVHGCKVTAVTVTEPFGGQFGFASDLWSPSDEELSEFEAEKREQAESILGPIQDRAEAAGVPIETVHIPQRLVARAIVELAEKIGCDAIVMASHGRTGINRAMLGSQAAEIAASAHVPVIIAR